MNNKEKSITNRENELTPAALAEELFPLMKDYFIGKFSLNENIISCEFESGGRFKIIVEKINK